MSASAAVRADAWASSGAAGDGWASFRYQDRQFERPGVKLLPGEFYVSGEDIVLTTVLGSCVAACIRDPRLGIGGMNHFMLPDGELGGGSSARYGSFAMEVLINELLKAGARRSGLEAKVFGGGAVLRSFTDSHVGQRNAQFVLDYLKAERIPVLAQDLGDTCPRKVFFLPTEGRVMVRRLSTTLATRDLADESAYRSRITTAPVSGGVELFD